MNIYGEYARMLATGLNRKDQAVGVLDRMIEIFPNSADSHLERGKWYLQQTLGRQISDSADQDGSLARAFETAEKDAEAAMSISNESIESFEFAIQVKFRQGKFDEAKSMAQYASEKYPLH